MNGKIKLAKNSISIFTMQSSLVFVGIFTTILVARTLGPSGKGAYVLATLIPWFLVEFGSLGIGTAIVYFIGQQKYKLEEIASTAGFFAVCWGTLLVALALILYRFLFPLFLKGLAPLLVVTTITIVPLWLLNSYFNFVLLAEDRIAQFNLMAGIRPCSFLAFYLLWLLLPFDRLLGAVLAWVIACIISAAFSIRFVKKLTFLKLSFDRTLLREMLGYGIRANFGNILLYFNYRLDFLLVGVFLNPTQVGLYSAAIAISEAIWRIPNAIGIALFPKISHSEIEEGNLLTAVMTRNTVFLVSLASLPFIIFGKGLVSVILGAEFLACLPALWLLLPGVVIVSTSRVLVHYFNGCGKPLVNGLGGLVSLALMILLDILLIPRWGIAGAAVACTISYATLSFIMVYYFSVSTQTPLRAILVLESRDLKRYVDMGKRIFNGKQLSSIKARWAARKKV